MSCLRLSLLSLSRTDIRFSYYIIFLQKYLASPLQCKLLDGRAHDLWPIPHPAQHFAHVFDHGHMLANENVGSAWDIGNYTCRRVKSDANALISLGLVPT